MVCVVPCRHYPVFGVLRHFDEFLIRMGRTCSKAGSSAEANFEQEIAHQSPPCGTCHSFAPKETRISQIREMESTLGPDVGRSMRLGTEIGDPTSRGWPKLRCPRQRGPDSIIGTTRKLAVWPNQAPSVMGAKSPQYALRKGRVQRKARKSCTIESVTMRTPTAVISPRAGARLTSHPPNGAAITPPSTSGINCSRSTAPISTKNVVAAEMVTKNSAVLTEPTE